MGDDQQLEAFRPGAQTTSSARSLMRYGKRGVLLLLAGASLYLLLPSLLAVFGSWRSLSHLDWPFAVLVGDLATPSESALRGTMRMIAGELAVDDEVARVGGRIAVVAAATSIESARERALALEEACERAGCRATFGWAFHPQDGDDALSLFGSASERLEARRQALGEAAPPPIVTELRTRSA
mgnify:CR=1 FL=1